MSDSSEQNVTASDDQALNDEALESVAGGAFVGPTPPVIGPGDVQLTIVKDPYPLPIGTVPGNTTA